jgi:tetratricopeptide (TPR) repeat protein
MTMVPESSNPQNNKSRNTFFSLETWKWIAGVVIILLFTSMTYSRNLFWRQDQMGFWETVVKQSPGKFRPHLSLSVQYDRKGLLNQAASELRTAISLDPQSSFTPINHNNLGWIYVRQNRLEEAAQEFRIAVDMQGNYYIAWRNLQTACERLGRFDEGEKARKTADAIEHYDKGKRLAEQGRFEDAIREFQIAIILKSDFDEANRELANTLHKIAPP